MQGSMTEADVLRRHRKQLAGAVHARIMRDRTQRVPGKAGHRICWQQKGVGKRSRGTDDGVLD